MELTYMVRGADGKQYGPATLEQLDGWIKEGRLAAQAEVKRSDVDYWAAAGEYQELQPMFGGTAAAPAATSRSAVRFVRPVSRRRSRAARVSRLAAGCRPRPDAHCHGGFRTESTHRPKNPNGSSSR